MTQQSGVHITPAENLRFQALATVVTPVFKNLTPSSGLYWASVLIPTCPTETHMYINNSSKNNFKKFRKILL